MAYRMDLPLDMGYIQPVFQASMLRKFVGDQSTIVALESVDFEKNLTCVEIPIEIFDMQVKRIHNKDIASVKVVWRN